MASAETTLDLSSEALRTMMKVLKISLFRMASISRKPSIPGMSRSVITMGGLSRLKSDRAWRPSEASSTS